MQLLRDIVGLIHQMMVILTGSRGEILVADPAPVHPAAVYPPGRGIEPGLPEFFFYREDPAEHGKTVAGGVMHFLVFLQDLFCGSGWFLPGIPVGS